MRYEPDSDAVNLSLTTSDRDMKPIHYKTGTENADIARFICKVYQIEWYSNDGRCGTVRFICKVYQIEWYSNDRRNGRCREKIKRENLKKRQTEAGEIYEAGKGGNWKWKFPENEFVFSLSFFSSSSSFSRK